MEEKPTVSFGFSKKTETKTLIKSAVSEDTDDGKADTDFVLSLEGNEVNSTAPKKKETGPYVIPLIKKNRWRVGAEKRLADVKKEFDLNDLDQQAAKEVLEEIARHNEIWEERDKPDPNLSIPLMMQNKIPEGFETDEKLDVALRPEAPDDADYEQIPIEHFGLAMLRGMGWRDGQGIGKNGKVFSPVEAQLRPKGLGLGADRSQAAGDKDKKTNNKSADKDDEELVMKKGSLCVVLSGKYKGLYGVIEGFDEENARMVIKLTLSGQSITLIQYSVKLVDKKEYDKYSKYLNKGKVDKYNDDKQQLNGQDSQNDRSSRDSDKSDKDRDSDRSRKHGKHRDTDDKKNHKRKHRSDDKGRPGDQSKQSKSDSSLDSKSANMHSDRESTNLWLRKDIRVRVVDKHYKKGKHYKEKVVVVDVISFDNAVCRTDDGKVLEGLSHSQLETVIPRQDDAFVMICSGRHKGKLGKIVKKKKDTCQALVHLLADSDHVAEVGFDDICEYVGVIDDEFDY